MAQKIFFNPYSFVPLSDKVFALSEEEKEQLKSAQDVPFSDGISGYLDVSFKAETPFCVRCEEGGTNAKSENFYVPATSLKGMIRNVFDIIALTNIRNYMANNRYSMRDLNSPDYELKAQDKPQKGGFLIQYKSDFYIIPCKSGCDPIKYTYGMIEEDEGVSSESFRRLRKIADKYSALPDYVFQSEDDNWFMWFFSGFMNNKEHEFLFEIPRIKEESLLKLEGDELKDFIFVHQIENENEAWNFWKKKLKNYSSLEEIERDEFKKIAPCFFRTKMNKEGVEVVRDLGFSFLYRALYDKTTHDCLPAAYREGLLDLSQAVFGYTSREDSLKGRVQFTNAFILKAETIEQQVFVLGSPKPTFYPFYLQQNKGGKQTYFSPQATISGWKRPLIHEKEQKGVSCGKPKIETPFTPLGAGTEFTSRIRFHNLRPYELGALLSAITFCGKSDTCYHSLGFAKVYGYGKMKVKDVKLTTVDTPEIYDIKTLMKVFEEKILKSTGLTKQKWEQTLSPLFLLASGAYTENKEIRYPILSNPKEFVTIKQEKQGIKDFSPQQ